MSGSGYRLSVDYRGFTLLEVLLASALLGFLVTGLAAIFTGSMTLREKANDQLEMVAPRWRVISLLQKDLMSVMPPVGTLAGEFLGEKDEEHDRRLDTVRFCTASGAPVGTLPWGDMVRVEYSVAEDEENNALQLARSEYRNLLTSVEMEDDSNQEILLVGVESFELAYWRADEELWEESWNAEEEESALPDAVRVLITFIPYNEDKPDLCPAPIAVVMPLIIKPAEAGESTNKVGEPKSNSAQGGGGGGGGGGR